MSEAVRKMSANGKKVYALSFMKDYAVKITRMLTQTMCRIFVFIVSFVEVSAVMTVVYSRDDI